MNSKMNVSKKYIITFKHIMAFFIIFCMALSVVFADVDLYMPNSGNNIPLITSVDQYYSVVFDGEGEAIVTLKLIVKNSDTDPINTINLEIPGVNVNVLGVLQETSGYEERKCSRWVNGCIEEGAGQTCIQYDYNGNCIRYETPCLKNGQICESYYTYYNNQMVYKKIKVEPVRLSNSINVPINLESAVKENGQTSILIVYKANGYSDSSIGVQKFSFETAKLSYTSGTVRVAVNVQSGLYLKGSNSNVNYQPSYANYLGGIESMSADKTIFSEAANQIGSYSRQIEYQNGLVKTASYLDPFESFTVEGKYGKSWIRINLSQVFLVTLLLLGVILFLAYGIKKLKAYSADAVEKAPVKKIEEKQKQHKHNFMIPFMTGLFSSIGITLLWVITIILIKVADNVMQSGIDEIFGLLLVLISVLITFAVLIGVPIYTGSKHGGLSGIFTTIAIFLWLFVFAIICFFIAALLTPRTMIIY